MNEIQQTGPSILLFAADANDACEVLEALAPGDLGVEVCIVTTEHEFEETLVSGRAALVVAGARLPSARKHRALANLRTQNEKIPFIFIAKEEEGEERASLLQAGATDGITVGELSRLPRVAQRALREGQERMMRQRVESLSRESDARFRQLTDALPQLVWTLDAEGALLFSNAAWQAAVHLEGAQWCDPRVVHPEDQRICQEEWKLAQQTQTGFAIEARMLNRRDGEYHWYFIRVQRLAQSIEGATWLGTATDQDEQRKREMALRTAEKLAVTGRMAATIAHEINNPLESLTNLVFLLRQESGLPPKVMEYLEIADYELQRVSAISKQTLSFYRDSSAHVEVEARGLVEEALRIFEPRLRTKQIHFTNHASDGIKFVASRGEVRQVLLNLIGNAIDALSSGGSLNVHAEAVEHKGKRMVEIRVVDNGQGVQPEHLEHLFEPFFSTKGMHGTGLGLWVSRGIAEQHGGMLEIASKARAAEGAADEECGTTVTLRLPVVSREGGAQRRQATQGQGGGLAGLPN